MNNALNQRLTIACGADAKYALSLAVTLRSLLMTLRRGASLDLYVVDGGLGSAVARLKKAVDQAAHANHLDCRLHIVAVEESALSVLKELPQAAHLNFTIFLRLLLPNLLPHETEKVIYLDSDLLFLESVEGLWNQDMAGKAVLAVQDYVIQTVSSPLGLADYAALGYAPDQWYFNSGVMVIDLKRWRDEQIPARVMRYNRERPGQIKFPDQDGLNAVLANDCGFLDLRWNVTVYSPDLNDWTNGEFRERVRPRLSELMTQPAVVHYASGSKPWLAGNHAPLRSQWFRYLRESGWLTPGAFFAFYSGWTARNSWRTAKSAWRKLHTAGAKPNRFPAS